MNNISIKQTLLFGIWLSLCLGCFFGLSWYKAQPGLVGKLQVIWPQNVAIGLDKQSYNVVMFAHPKCGCTYASLRELEKLILTKKEKLNSKIFFYRPSGSKSDWSEGESRALAAKLEGASIHDDEGGHVARSFGALTSGQVMVYSPEGKLFYAGGITESRGHVGTNAGSQAIANVIETNQPSSKKEHTYGCVLFNESEMKEYKKRNI